MIAPPGSFRVPILSLLGRFEEDDLLCQAVSNLRSSDTSLVQSSLSAIQRAIEDPVVIETLR
jgi:hypothetical protein